MDLNTIKLPEPLVADLYKNDLVDIAGSAQHIVIPDKETPYKYLGDNRKKILIAVNYSGVVHIPDAQLPFLTNLLSAVGLNLADVAVYNTRGKPQSAEALAWFGCKTVFLFGTDPAVFDLPLNFPHFQVQPFNQTTYLSSPPLHEIENDKVLKSKLWVCLKRIFNL